MTEDEKLERIGLNLSKNLNDFLRNHGIGLSEFYRKAGEDFLPRYLEKIQEELKKEPSRQMKTNRSNKPLVVK